MNPLSTDAARQASSRSAPRPGAAAPLLYWLLVALGIAATILSGASDMERGTGLVIGALLGTALGQVFAVARFRLWLCVFVVLPMVGAALWAATPFWQDGWTTFEIAVLAFVPAILCGYLCLSERGGLVAFWFPSSLWMVAILDGQAGNELAGQGSVLLLVALALLFVAFLAVRESRRVAIWQRHANVAMAPSRPVAVLRRAPLRALGHVAWAGMIGVAAMAIAAWVAPHLWQQEAVPAPPTTAALSVPAVLGVGGGWVPCRDGDVEEVRRVRTREYFPLLHAEDEHRPLPRRAVAPCGHDAWAQGQSVEPSVTRYGGSREPEYVSPYAAGRPGIPYSSQPLSPAPPLPAMPQAVPPPTQVVQSPPAQPAPPVPVHEAASARSPPPAPVAPPPLASPVLATRSTPTPVSRAAPPPAPLRAIAAYPAAHAPRPDGHPVAWLLMVAALALALNVLLRPVRRLLTLRHLARPFWPETLEERVSNQWQLMLIGLRDAGWLAGVAEAPGALARRVGVEGAEECARVLERARHGVRVDASDLDAMARAARAVYETARQRTGRLARAASWLRWPLL